MNQRVKCSNQEHHSFSTFPMSRALYSMGTGMPNDRPYQEPCLYKYKSHSTVCSRAHKPVVHLFTSCYLLPATSMEEALLSFAGRSKRELKKQVFEEKLNQKATWILQRYKQLFILQPLLYSIEREKKDKKKKPHRFKIRCQEECKPA